MQMKNNKVADIKIKALFKYFKYLKKQKKILTKRQNTLDLYFNFSIKNK